MQTRSRSEYAEGGSLLDRVREDLAERIAIDSHGEMIRNQGDKDATTRRMLEAILAIKEARADNLSSIPAALDPGSKAQ